MSQPHEEPGTAPALAKPYLDEHSNLVIPFDGNPKYHHWKGGQGTLATLKEIGAPPELLRQYERQGTDASQL